MIGIIYYAYGAPNRLDNVESFFSHMLQGKTPSPQMMAGLNKRFRDFGTVDPLSAVTKRQAKGIEQVLKQSIGEEVKVYNAYKHTSPFVNETVKQMVEDGVTKIVTLPAALLYSKTGTGAFQADVREAVEQTGTDIEVVNVENGHLHPQIVGVLADRVKSAYGWLPQTVQEDTPVLFTVHSQPVNPELNEVYVKQYLELAGAIAEQLRLPNWKAVYRSVHQKDTWLGPDVLDIIRGEAEKGAKGIVVCELLSTIADVEVFFEIGEDCQNICRELNLEFVRAEFPSDSFDFVNALAAVVQEQLLAKSVLI